MSTDLDVVGIGALNVDFLVPAVVPALVREWGTEQVLDTALIPADGRAALGGSAFNTIHAIAHCHTGLRLGYVGVAGRMPVPELSVPATFDALGIDRRYVFDDEALSGVCVAVMRDGERTLLTHPGANAAFPDHLDRAFDDLVGYLGRARLLHVTSFLDDRSPGRLLALLTAVKAAHPGTRISLDPGHVWATHRTAEIDGLVRLADILLVNAREAGALAGTGTGAVVVVKHASGIRVGTRFLTQVPLAASQIVDATGAGDVFAAGLLIPLATDPAQVEAGCRLGMRLARHRLRYAAISGYARLVREFMTAGGQHRTTG